MTSTTIIRDTDGVAHVRASSLAGAFRGQGFAAAQDRLWQMEFDRRRAFGRLAEVIGPAGLASDRFHRRMGLPAAARESLATLGDEARDALDAYAAGVNAFLASGPDLPPEFALLDHEPEPWEATHSVGLFQVRHLAMGTYETKVWRSGLVHRLGADVARLWPEVPEIAIDPASVGLGSLGRPLAGGPMHDAVEALGAFDEDAASNNLAISGRRTATGRPIVAGDPHRAIDLPNVYWPNHLTAGDVDAIGLSFPGVPGFPHFGHTAGVAWCITHGMADDQDVYVVDLRPAGDGVEYRGPDGWTHADVRTERIDVRDGEAVEVRCVSTEHGPVVTDRTDVGLAVRWTALDGPDTTIDSLVPMLRAATVDDLDAAFEPWVVPVNNVLMADTTGAIAYRMRGRLARRRTDNGWTAVPGDDPDRRWTGHVPDAELPRWRDPEVGFLVTANNPITAAGGGPYVSHDFAHPTRAHTLTRLLGERTDWDVAAVEDLLTDTTSPVAARFAARLVALRGLHPVEERAVALLDGWDARMDADQAAPAVYGTTRAELVAVLCHTHALHDDRLPGVAGPSLHTTMRFVNARLAFWIDDPELVPDQALRSALRSACRRLELTQGSDPRRWRWGAAHTALFVHPLASLRPDLADALVTPPPVELGGDNECVWATSIAPPSTRASNAQVARYVFDVGSWDDSRWILPHGVSGDPRSPHHLDLLDDWASGRHRPMRWSTAAIDAATESVTELEG